MMITDDDHSIRKLFFFFARDNVLPLYEGGEGAAVSFSLRHAILAVFRGLV